jgi:hypothetical protein
MKTSDTRYIELDDAQIDRIIINDLQLAYIVSKPKLQKAIKRVLKHYMLKTDYEEWYATRMVKFIT